VDYISSLGKHTAVAFEECSLSAWLFDILHKHVEEIIVCDPVANRQYKRAKTDKLDAYNLAQLLRGGFLKPVFHDGSKRERFRILVSAYEDTVIEIVRTRNRLTSIIRRFRADRACSGSHQRDIEVIIRLSREQLSSLLKIKKEYVECIVKTLRNFPESRLLTSIPGIGYIHAAKIISQVVDPRRFRTKYKFFAYCGLVRHPRISGGRCYGSRYIWGNRMLKCVFKMAAHSAIRGKNPLKEYSHGLLSRGLHPVAARNAVARKIASLALALWRRRQKFNENRFWEKIIREKKEVF